MNSLIAASIAVSMQFFTVTHHAGPWNLSQSISSTYGTNVYYQLDEDYEIGDTVLVLYDDDEVVFEKKFDLLSVK
jgi:hypothetical protein